MQIFGQVWLWSLGSFLLGAVFTWLLLVRPMRKKLIELMEAGPEAEARPEQPVTRVAEPVPAAPLGPLTATDRSLDDLFDSQQKKAPPALPPLPPPTATPPAPAPTLTPFSLSPQPSSPRPAPLLPPATPMPMPEPTKSRLDPGPTAPPEPPLQPPHDDSDTELSDNPFIRFAESTTVFVPPSNLPVPPDVEPSGEDWFSKEDEDDPHLITDVDDDEQVDETGTIFTQHTTPIPADMIRLLDDSQPPAAPTEAPAELTQTVMPVSRHGIADEQDGQYQQEAEYPPAAQEYEPEQQYQPAAHEYQAAPQEYEQPGQEYQASQERYEPAQQHEHGAHEYQQEYPAAPQEYQPAVEQYDDAPRQQEPVSREYEPAVQQYEPAPEYQSVPSAAHAYQPAPETGRSLFEPIVPVAEQEAAEADFVPPGPFGPGSAMPLPGGGSPAPEFNVKASVTALRYCTQDNPQFDRIVAEVWFRSPSDAERVGFRVLS